MWSVKRVVNQLKECSAESRRIFTTLGYAILNATTKDEIETIFKVMCGEAPIDEAAEFLSNSDQISKYMIKHKPGHCRSTWLLSTSHNSQYMTWSRQDWFENTSIVATSKWLWNLWLETYLLTLLGCCWRVMVPISHSCLNQRTFHLLSPVDW